MTSAGQPTEGLMRSGYTRRATAFTLIELLVVVAIVAILMSILVTSLQRAREQAKVVVCQSNLRQIMVGFFCYTGEHNGVVPVATGHELGGRKGRMDLEDEDWAPAVMFGGGLPAEERLLNPYVADSYELFRCPCDKGEPIYWIENARYPPNLTAYELYGTSYFYASGCNRGMGVLMPMGLAKLVGLDFCYGDFAETPLPNAEPLQVTFFPYPSRKVVIGDLPIHRTMPSIAAHPKAHWHRRGRGHVWVNAGFLDGHAELLRVFPFDVGEYPEWEGVTTMPNLSNPYY